MIFIHWIYFQADKKKDMVQTKKDIYFRNIIVGVKDSNRNCDFTKSLDPLWISLTPFDLGINLFYQNPYLWFVKFR